LSPNGPSAVPSKGGHLQGEKPGARGPRPLGAAMDTSACAANGEKYCRNGGMTFAQERGSG